MFIKPWAMNALDGEPEYDAATLRLHSTALLGGSGTPMRARSGLIDTSSMIATVNEPAIMLDPGLIVIATASGTYITGLDEAWIGELSPRHATLTRIDKIIFEVSDTDLARTAQIRIISGTPAPIPVAPATPTGAVAIGTLTVPATGGGMVLYTQQIGYTAARGGVINVPNETALANTTAIDGSIAYCEDTKTGYFRANARWNALYSHKGWVNLSRAAGLTGTLRYCVRDPWVTISVNLTGNVKTGVSDLSAAGVIPASLRLVTTGTNPRAAAYFGSGTNGTLYVDSAGTIGAIHEAGVTRLIAQGLMYYMTDPTAP